jgi:hypothetical protein
MDDVMSEREEQRGRDIKVKVKSGNECVFKRVHFF